MILTKSFLREQARKKNIYESDFQRSHIINENLELAHSYYVDYAKKEKRYDIFLSHSSLDKELVLALVALFNDAKFSVYVDWIEDRQLDRSNVNKDTAETLRSRMNTSTGLAYVSTTNVINSKWCPWELGYFDGKKNSRCCILPVMENNTFNGQEYLGLYPHMEYEPTIGGIYNFYVCDPDTNEKVKLADWLRGENPGNH